MTCKKSLKEHNNNEWERKDEKIRVRASERDVYAHFCYPVVIVLQGDKRLASSHSRVIEMTHIDLSSVSVSVSNMHQIYLLK